MYNLQKEKIKIWQWVCRYFSDAGLDLVEVMKADTYDAKVNKNVTVNGLDNPTVNVDVQTESVASKVES